MNTSSNLGTSKSTIVFGGVVMIEGVRLLIEAASAAMGGGRQATVEGSIRPLPFARTSCDLLPEKFLVLR